MVLGTGTLSAGDLRSPDFMQAARRGFDALYRLDYAAADQIFTQLAQEYPKHPAPPLYLAANSWLEFLFDRLDLDLDKFVSPGYFADARAVDVPIEIRRRYQENIEKARQLCTDLLEKDPYDLEALYFMGAVEGVQGSYAFTVEHSVGNAFAFGKRAYRYHSQILERAPDFYDAYLSAGLYEYIVANLPWYIKWFTTLFGYRGSEERGFEYLNLAAQNGEFVSDDSSVLQMVLFVREKRYRDALRLAEQLHAKYPENYIFHVNQAQILERMGRQTESLDVYRRISQLAAAGAHNYQSLPQARFNHQLALKLRDSGQPELACSYFESALESPDVSDRDRVTGHLELGRTLARLGRPETAAEHLRMVLSLPDYDGAAREASRLLKELQSDGD